MPGRRSITSRREKVSPTRPSRRSEWNRRPSKETMPAASWPRCCKACKPSAVMAAASGWPKMPNTPHSSRNRSASASRKVSVMVFDISARHSPSFEQVLHAGATRSIVPDIGAPGGGRVDFAMLVGRGLGGFGVLGPLPFQLLQNGGFGVLRQLLLEPVAGAAEHDFRLRVQNPTRFAAIGDEPVEE